MTCPPNVETSRPSLPTVLSLHSSPSPSFISTRVSNGTERLIERVVENWNELIFESLRRRKFRLGARRKGKKGRDVSALDENGSQKWTWECPLHPFESTWKSCIGRLGLSVWTLSRQIEISFRPEFRMDIGRERSDRFRRWIYGCWERERDADFRKRRFFLLLINDNEKLWDSIFFFFFQYFNEIILIF